MESNKSRRQDRENHQTIKEQKAENMFIPKYSMVVYLALLQNANFLVFIKYLMTHVSKIIRPYNVVNGMTFLLK